MEPELKECPFCGQYPEVYDGDQYSQIECNYCNFHIGLYKTDSVYEKEELFKKWNKRVIILR